MPSRVSNARATFSYLGPAGTFTELALAQIPEAKKANWKPVANVSEALDDVMLGRSTRAIIPVENSIEGGVSATSDALALSEGIHIYGEYLVPISFHLVARKGTKLADVKTVSTHPTAYPQCRNWLASNLPGHAFLPATSTAAAAAGLLDNDFADAAIAAPSITSHYPLSVLARNIGDNRHAQTRFIQVGLAGGSPRRTGADKTSLIIELPSDRPGALLEMLEQFAVRGVNLTRIESRPIGDRLGRYRFNVDTEGHVLDAAVGEALAGLHRFSPRVVFLGSYPRADRKQTKPEGNNSNLEFAEADGWLKKIRQTK